MRLARAYDEAIAGDETANLFKRLATAVSKYWICKSATWAVGEALECFGGNGYVEESGMPRLYREVPLLSIWEGSGNVNALDVLRAMARTAGVAARVHRRDRQRRRGRRRGSTRTSRASRRSSPTSTTSSSAPGASSR